MDPIPETDLGKVLDYYGVIYRNAPGWQNVLCPVHDERRPDCGVHLDSGEIHCHACPFRGDGLDLIQEREGIGLAQAIEFAEQEGFVRGDVSFHRGPPRKPGGGLSGQSRDRATNRRAAETRLRKPGRPA